MGVIKWKKFSDEQLREILDKNTTFKGALHDLGYNTQSNNNKIIKTIAEYLNYDLSNYLCGKDKNYYIGKIYGELTIIEIDEEKSKEKRRLWVKAQCSCGKVISVSHNALQRGNTKSCGHFMGIDLLGQRFGKLLVIQKGENKHSYKKNYWICQCDCGNITPPIEGASLRKENGTRSCGCLMSEGELLIGAFLKENNINFKKQFSFSDLIGQVEALRFDFAILNDKNKVVSLIEYQGIQHYCPVEYFGGQEEYEKQVKFDNLKREYCLKNNIPLLEISYKDKNKIEQILKGWSGLKYD